MLALCRQMQEIRRCEGEGSAPWQHEVLLSDLELEGLRPITRCASEEEAKEQLENVLRWSEGGRWCLEGFESHLTSVGEEV